MKLISLNITNFRSFRGRQVFEFPQEPGLYFMQGDNRVDDRLGGNGAGKSSIWDALHWLIHGKTSKGLTGGQVCNWGVKKGVEVSLVYFGDDNEQYEVRRTWGPISWTLTIFTNGAGADTDLTKAEGNQFLDELRVGIDAYQQSVMMAQAGKISTMFLDLKSEEQAKLFGSVLGLDRWLEYSARSARMETTKDTECRRLEAEAAELKGRLSAQQDFSSDVRRFENERKDRLASIESEYSRLLAKRPKLQKNYDGALNNERVARDKLSIVAGELDDRRFEREGIVEKADVLIEEAAVLRAELNAAEDGIKFLETHKHCPTCDLDLDPELRKRKIREKGETKAMIIGELTQATERMNEHKKFMDSINAAIKRSEGMAAEWRDRVADYASDAKALKLVFDDNEQALKKLEDDADDADNEVNPYKVMQERAHSSARTIQNALNDAGRALDAANDLRSRYGFWVRGFKDVRLAQIAQALTELEVEVNSELSALGLPGWELLFDVDRENKGGGISRGFSVNVLSPQNDKPVPWESWSGGEHQRLRIAGQMGLSNLIRTRMGVNLDFEVWDEPSKGLSPWGVQDLLKALQRRAQVEQRVIWLVDHTSHSFGGFAGGVTVVKTKDGSHLEYA